MAQRLPRWPKWLFALTVLGATIFGILGASYYIYTSRVQAQQKSLEERKVAYEAEIARLEQQRIVEHVVAEQVPTPVTVEDCDQISIPFGISQICVPVVRTEMREITKTVQVEDPVVRARLDKAYEELKSLSTQAETTVDRTKDVKEWVEISRKLMAPLLSLVVVAAALFIILSRQYGPESEKWAFGSIGTVIGFWLS